jgi:hypothetical protein
LHANQRHKDGDDRNIFDGSKQPSPPPRSPRNSFLSPGGANLSLPGSNLGIVLGPNALREPRITLLPSTHQCKDEKHKKANLYNFHTISTWLLYPVLIKYMEPLDFPCFGWNGNCKSNQKVSLLEQAVYKTKKGIWQ